MLRTPANSTSVRDLRDQGYQVLGTLNADLVRAARARINSWISLGMTDSGRAGLSHENLLQDYAWNSYGDEATRDSEAIHACFRPLEDEVRARVGTDVSFSYKPDSTQVALRFPGSFGYPHIDGGVVEGNSELWIPSAVAVVYLSDVGLDDAPLQVWPDAIGQIRDWANRALAAGSSEDAKNNARTELTDLMWQLRTTVPAKPVTGPAGTVILCHPALPHCNGVGGPDIRYALIRRYYRDGLKRQDWTQGLNLLAGHLKVWQSSREPIEAAAVRHLAVA